MITISLPNIFTKGFPRYLLEPYLAGIIIDIVIETP